ncbi:putative TauD/TfdA-like domain-containing protein [Seiridium cardinale]|uniref:TauD/TfdA-like domain-containing protein n=1 Tax=Seiridium cardinale TaxID=138064 RepID=A0ABR2XH20_9PEZI
MADIESRKHISPDSGLPITLHPKFSDKIKNHVPPRGASERDSARKRSSFFRRPGEEGPVLSRQLSQLNPQQLDELVLLVNERGVVFFRNQDLTTEKQVELFEHYEILDRAPGAGGRQTCHHSREQGKPSRTPEIHPLPSGDFHADTSFEINPPSYSMLRMEEHPDVGGDTAWVSGYGLTPRRAHIAVAVRYHARPVGLTGLKALNVNPGFVTTFSELNKVESDKLLDFFQYHIHSADDHYVRWKWTVGSVAMWDNRCSVHRVIPGRYEGNRRGIRTTVFGEKPYFDPSSESRY